MTLSRGLLYPNVNVDVDVDVNSFTGWTEMDDQHRLLDCD